MGLTFTKTVNFIHMADGTREEYAWLKANDEARPMPVADNVLGLLDGLRGGVPEDRVRLDRILPKAGLGELDGVLVPRGYGAIDELVHGRQLSGELGLPYGPPKA